MVDQATTKEESASGAHGEGSIEKKVTQGNKAFKKKNVKSNNEKQDGVPVLLKGVCFTVARDGPDLYLKALKARKNSEIWQNKKNDGTNGGEKAGTRKKRKKSTRKEKSERQR